MAATKDPEDGSEILPFAATALSKLSNIEGVNEMKLKDVVDEEEHLLLLVRNELILREGEKHLQKKSKENKSANTKTQYQ